MIPTTTKHWLSWFGRAHIVWFAESSPKGPLTHSGPETKHEPLIGMIAPQNLIHELQLSGRGAVQERLCSLRRVMFDKTCPHRKHRSGWASSLLNLNKVRLRQGTGTGRKQERNSCTGGWGPWYGAEEEGNAWQPCTPHGSLLLTARGNPFQPEIFVDWLSTQLALPFPLFPRVGGGARAIASSRRNYAYRLYCIDIVHQPCALGGLE